MAQRNLQSETWWQEWIARVVESELNQGFFQSQLGLARRHNLMGFFTVFYLYVAENGEPGMKDILLPLILASIAKLG
jgi:hypothetical protein